jgi:hypothetical protein
VDQRIQEEQQRQKLTGSPVTRSASTARRSTSSRNESPSAKAGTARNRSSDVSGEGRGPDPSEFESAFVIDDEEPSRVGTPSQTEKSVENGAENEKTTTEDGVTSNSDVAGEKPTEEVKAPVAPELPQEVRTKLRKLEKLESRYQGNLRDGSASLGITSNAWE